MKKSLLILLTIFSLTTITHGQNYGWTDISANIPTEADLSDVFFVSDNEGWISVSSDAIILHTTDGGETFELQTTQYPTEAIYMIDENEGYAGGANGRVYRTTDGGENWIAIGSISVTLTDIDFATTTQGYCCGDHGAVFSITPQGVENLNSGLASNLHGISAPSVEKVWICGGAIIVYYNGSTFTFQSGPAGTYNSIFFINDDEGWVVGDAGLIGGTNDGGNHWKSLAKTDESIYDTYSPNGVDVWAVGSGGRIMHSPNGDDFWWNSSQDQGNNTVWNIQGAGLTTNFLRGVHFTSPTNGYVVGNGKTLLKYTEVSGIGDGVETLAFEIYPNPAQNIIQIQCSEFKTESGIIEILSLDGKKILEKEIEIGIENIELDLNNLKSGIYLCKISTDKKSSTKKLIIE